MSGAVNLSRRRFVRNSSLLAGGLVLGAHLPWSKALAADAAPFEPNALIAVRPDGRVVMQFTWNELGQGACTSLAATVAEELRVGLGDVDVETPVWEPKYGFNVTGGSQSMRRSWDPLRKAAAAARTMLVAAGAARLGADVVACRAEDGRVVGPDGASVPYGELVADAAALDVPGDPPLIPRSEHRIVGTRYPRRDTPAKVRGEPVYGLDLDRPGLLRAAVAAPPSLGATVAAVDDAATRAVPGVRDVVRVGDDRVAVLADDAWSALRGRDALSVDWNPGRDADWSTEKLWAAYAERAAEPGAVRRDDGDLDARLAEAATVLRAEYRTPMICHAPMAPTACIARVAEDRVEFEGPNQGPVIVRGALYEELRVRDVRVRSPWVGSAFGRRLIPDYAVEAALISRAAGGAEVQLVWSREDEQRRDHYRPASLHRMTGALDAEGNVSALDITVVASSIAESRDPGSVGNAADDAVISGVLDSPYAPAAFRAAHAHAPTPSPLGWWRGVYDVQNALANECFLDELAQAAGRDPVELRLAMLPADARLRGVAEAAARLAGWPEPSTPGRSLGFACHGCFGSVAAVVAEAEMDGERPVVRKLTSVVECGPCVNPDAVRAQMEGGAAMALGQLYHERVTWRDGAVVEDNFDSYTLLTMDEMPEVVTHVLASDHPIGGVGEPVLCPVMPAALNACSRAAGTRFREVPLG